MRLDHTTLRTGNLPGLCRLSDEVFDLRDGFGPTFGFRGHWLYDGDEPLVHTIPIRLGSATSIVVGEGIDDVACMRDDYDAFRERLDNRGVAYSRMELPRNRRAPPVSARAGQSADRGCLSGQGATRTTPGFAVQKLRFTLCHRRRARADSRA